MTASARRAIVWLAATCVVPLLAHAPAGRTLAAAAGPRPQDDGGGPRARGYESAYNLDYDQAEKTFRQLLADGPEDPALHRALASVAWLRITFARGTVTVDEFLGSGARQDIQMTPPPPALARQFHDHATRAQALAEAAARARPRDVDAQYQLGASLGLIASYTATIEGRIGASFGPARGAYRAHERVLELAPHRKDAGLVVGTYRYLVSLLWLPTRLLAYMAGFGGGRERGLRMIEEAAAYPSDAQPEARFALVLLYNREQRHDDALRTLSALRERYPRNRLLWLESGATALRAGRADEAERLLAAGVARAAADRRERAFGEEALWQHKLALAAFARKDLATAEHRSRAALATPARDWVRARAQLTLGKILDLRGERSAAVAAYVQAARLADTGRDAATRHEANELARRPFR